MGKLINMLIFTEHIRYKCMEEMGSYKKRRTIEVGREAIWHRTTLVVIRGTLRISFAIRDGVSQTLRPTVSRRRIVLLSARNTGN